jgi:hypothetical protein
MQHARVVSLLDRGASRETRSALAMAEHPFSTPAKMLDPTCEPFEIQACRMFTNFVVGVFEPGSIVLITVAAAPRRRGALAA